MKKQKIKYLGTLSIIVLLCSPIFVFGQISLERQVIGSTGNFYNNVNSGLSISYTAGEAVVNTFESNPYFFTQGFHQPDGLLLTSISFININTKTICPDVKLGKITVNEVGGCLPPYVVRLRQMKNGIYSTVDSIPDIQENEEVIFSNLGIDTFIVEVIGATYCVKTDTILLEAKNPEGCAMKVYSGLTPNNDGSNDLWIIDNIEIYGENQVNIFNRWGNLIWSEKNYDNVEVVWDGNNKNGNSLPDATYFYVIETESETFKGWVEITR